MALGSNTVTGLYLGHHRLSNLESCWFEVKQGCVETRGSFADKASRDSSGMSSLELLLGVFEGFQL
jgi:hypothetical protein